MESGNISSYATADTTRETGKGPMNLGANLGARNSLRRLAVDNST
jgi:hypothetical protein